MHRLRYGFVASLPQTAARAVRSQTAGGPSTARRPMGTSKGPYIAPFLTSSLQLVDKERYLLKVLPVDLPDRTATISMATLKNRTLNPAVNRFMEHIRNFTQVVRDAQPVRKR